MGGCRECKNIWWYLFSFWNNYGGTGKRKWRGWEVFTRRFWRYREYIWHDSFGKYLRRLFGCKHDPVFLDETCDGGKDIIYCFKCERELPQ